MDTIKTAELEHVMRLAAKAKAEGVRLYVDRRDGRHYASSATTTGRLYFVTLASCTCPGFATHQRCKHWAALQLAIAVDGNPEPDPGMTITCAHVDGHYSLDADPQWMEPRTEILVDGDVKVRITGETCGLHVHWIEGGRPIDDLTGCTPSYLDHAECVRYWIESLDTRVPAHVAMQAAGLFPAGEFVDAEPMVAA
jgi:hypothetical protein